MAVTNSVKCERCDCRAHDPEPCKSATRTWDVPAGTASPWVPCGCAGLPVVDAPAFDPVTVDLGTLSEADIQRIIDACRYQAARHTLDESVRFETLANYVELRLNLARRAARANDSVVVPAEPWGGILPKQPER